MSRFSDRVTAIHEAGHAVAYCHFTHGIHKAELIQPGANHVDQRGRVRKGLLGIVQPVTHLNEQVYVMSGTKDIDALAPKVGGSKEDRETFLAAFYDRGVRVMISTWAGPYAEAKHRRRSPFYLMFGEDEKEARNIANFIEPAEDKREALRDRVEDIVRRFLREPSVWARIQAIAEVLVRERAIDFDHPLVRDIAQWQPLTEISLRSA
jgi:hypothetical protein